MKGYFKPQYPTKWFMFGGLCATLGFSLSMNPQHFNNIARWSPNDPLNAVHFASQVQAEALVEIEDKQQSFIPHNGHVFTVDYGKVKDANQYAARITAPDQTTADACTGCNNIVVVTANDPREALRLFSLELSRMLTPAGSATQAQAEQEAPAKEESIVERYAKACEDKEDLECLTEQMVSLADDSKSTERDVTRFFRAHLERPLREILNTPIDDYQVDATGWTHTYTTGGHASANMIIEQVMSEVAPAKSNGTRDRILLLTAGAYSERLRHAQALHRQNNPAGLAIATRIVAETQNPQMFLAQIVSPFGLNPDVTEAQIRAFATKARSVVVSRVNGVTSQIRPDNFASLPIPGLGDSGTEVVAPGAPGTVAGNTYELRLVPRFAGDLGSQLLAPSATPQFSGSIQVVPSSGPAAGVAPGYNQPQPPLTTWPQQTQPGMQNPPYQTPGFNPNGFNPQGNQQFGVSPMNTRFR